MQAYLLGELLDVAAALDHVLTLLVVRPQLAINPLKVAARQGSSAREGFRVR